LSLQANPAEFQNLFHGSAFTLGNLPFEIDQLPFVIQIDFRVVEYLVD
jgi:hypothetical protein